MRTRRGMSIVEVAAATVVIAVLMSSTAMGISRIIIQRRLLMQRTCAEQTIANVMEQIDNLPYEQLTRSKLSAIKPDAETIEFLPSASLDCTINETPQATVPAKRIRVTIQWAGQKNSPPNTLALVTWKYPLDQPDGKKEQP